MVLYNNYQPGSPNNSASNTAESLARTVRSEGSVYFQAFSMDPTAFVASTTAYFDGLRKVNDASGRSDINDLGYLQAAVRSMGMSKGVSPIGQLDPEDYTAIKNVFQGAYLNGTDWATYLQRRAQSPYASVNAGPTFSKSITSALKLIDKTDSEAILSDAYFQAYGKYPTMDQVGKFKNKWNAEAKRQLESTTTTGTSNTTGQSSASKSKSVTTGQGFTQDEQQQFLAGFLKENYNITGEEESGKAKILLDDLKRSYSDNLLPEPDLAEMIAFVGDAIGTSDAASYKQKVDAKLQEARTSAAKFYPGAADTLAAGQDIRSTYAEPAAKAVNSYLNTNFKYNNPRIKELINFNDGKTTRPMSANEIQKWAEKQPEFPTSDYGRSKAMNLSQAFKDGLK